MLLKITEIMKEKSVTVKELSQKSGVAVSFINYIISEEKSPTLRTLQKIATALEVRVKDLLDEHSSRDETYCSVNSKLAG